MLYSVCCAVAVTFAVHIILICFVVPRTEVCHCEDSSFVGSPWVISALLCYPSHAVLFCYLSGYFSHAVLLLYLWLCHAVLCFYWCYTCSYCVLCCVLCHVPGWILLYMSLPSVLLCIVLSPVLSCAVVLAVFLLCCGCILLYMLFLCHARSCCTIACSLYVSVLYHLHRVVRSGCM
jgi:hypothetical protein